MPKGPSNVKLMFLNQLLLEFSRNQTSEGKWFITSRKLDEICEIAQKPAKARDDVRGDYIAKLRGLYNAHLEYDRKNKRYILQNKPYFVLNLKLQLSTEMLTALAAGSIFVRKFLPHLETSSTAFEKELEKIFDKNLFIEGRSLASSVTMSLPIARIDGSVFSTVQQAIREKRTISFTYTSLSSEQPTRKEHFSPWKVYFTDKSWYVWGAAQDMEEGKTYKICRMHEIEAGSSKMYTPPLPGQEPETILNSLWFGRPGVAKYDVQLSFTHPLAESIEEMDWPEEVSITKDETSGEVFLKTRTPELYGVAFFVLAGAPHAVAVQPAELRKLVMTLSQQVHEKQQVVDEYEKEEEFNESKRRSGESTPDLSVDKNIESTDAAFSSQSGDDTLKQ